MVVPTDDNMGLRQFLEVGKNMTSTPITQSQPNSRTFVSTIDTYEPIAHMTKTNYHDRLNILVNNYKNTILVGQSKRIERIVLNANKSKSKRSNNTNANTNTTNNNTNANNTVSSGTCTGTGTGGTSTTSSSLTRGLSLTLSSSLNMRTSIDSQLSSSNNNQSNLALAGILNQPNPNPNPNPTSVSKRDQQSSISTSRSKSGIGSLFSSSHAKEVTKLQKEFNKYMTRQMTIYNEHCHLVLLGYESPIPSNSIMNNMRTSSVSSVGINSNSNNNNINKPNTLNTSTTTPSTSNTTNTTNIPSTMAINRILSETLPLEGYNDLLDDYADNLIENMMQHVSLTLSPILTSNTELIVKEFSTRIANSNGNGISKTNSGSKYSYFNKEFKKLSMHDRNNSSRNSGNSKKDSEFKMMNGTSRTNSRIGDDKHNTTTTNNNNTNATNNTSSNATSLSTTGSTSLNQSNFLFQPSRTPTGSTSISTTGSTTNSTSTSTANSPMNTTELKNFI